MTLVDAGPLVALVNASDRHHAERIAAAKRIHGRLVAAWPVLTEAMYLVGLSWPAPARLGDMLMEGHVDVPALEPDDLPRMRTLMDKYQDLPIDLADAALVRLAERERIRRVFTLDRRDLAVYRPEGLGRFDVIPRAR